MSEKNKATEKTAGNGRGEGRRRWEFNQENTGLRGEDREWKTSEGVPRQGIKKEVARNAFKRCAWKGKKESEWKLEEPEVWKRWPWLLLSR